MDELENKEGAVLASISMKRLSKEVYYSLKRQKDMTPNDIIKVTTLLFRNGVNEDLSPVVRKFLNGEIRATELISYLQTIDMPDHSHGHDSHGHDSHGHGGHGHGYGHGGHVRYSEDKINLSQTELKSILSALHRKPESLYKLVSFAH